MENKKKYYIYYSIVDGLILFGLLVIGIFSLSYLSQIEKAESNIDIYAMMDMYSKGSDHVIDEWPGTGAGSIYYGETRPDTCEEHELRCRKIEATSSEKIKKWRNKTFHFNSSYTYEYLYKNTVGPNETCPSGKKQCGIFDTMNNTLCLDVGEECPINFIVFSVNPPTGYNYTFKREQYDSSNMNIYYTNEAIDNYILTSKFKLSDGLVCFDNQRYNSPYSHSVLDEYKYGCKAINNTLYNPYYREIDTIIKYDLYEENGIIKKLKGIPLYPWESLKKQYTTLFNRPFVGYNKKCLEKHPESFGKFEREAKKQKNINIVEIISFSLIFACTILFVVKVFYQCNKIIYYNKYDWILGVTLIVFVIVKLVLLIELYSINFEYLCIDELNEILFYAYGSNNGKMKIFIIIEMLLLAVPIVNYGIFRLLLLLCHKLSTMETIPDNKDKETDMSDFTEKYQNYDTPAATPA